MYRIIVLLWTSPKSAKQRITSNLSASIEQKFKKIMHITYFVMSDVGVGDTIHTSSSKRTGILSPFCSLQRLRPDGTC